QLVEHAGRTLLPARDAGRRRRRRGRRRRRRDLSLHHPVDPGLPHRRGTARRGARVTEEEVITLITCGGEWNADVALYDHRTVARAIRDVHFVPGTPAPEL